MIRSYNDTLVNLMRSLTNGRNIRHKVRVLAFNQIIQSTIVAIYSSHNICFIVEVDKFLLNVLAVFSNFFKVDSSGVMFFRLDPVLLLYVQKQKKIQKNSEFALPNCVMKALKMRTISVEIV